MEFLLPNYPGLKLQRTYIGQDRLLLLVNSTLPNAVCPDCNEITDRVHSYYFRTLKDLSWADYTIRILLLARRFYCLNSACPKATFAERFGKAIKAYARRTSRCDTKLRAIADELGGTAGARLSTHLGIKVSRDTLLRILAKEELPSTSSSPRVIGIDDWAWKKGRNYGTIIVDLERHQPIDLLADCNANSVVAWLQAHPSVEIVSRDRGNVFIDGVTRGAPQAIQVADRWHLLNSLTKAVERFFLNHTQDIKAANAATEMLKRQPTKKEIERSQKRTKRMVDNYEQIKALHENKVPILHIARQLGLSRETVYQYLAKSEPPVSKQATYGGKSKIDPHKSYLIKRWNEGIRNASQLHRELIELGAQDLKVGSVKNFVSRLRRAKGEGRSFKPQEPNVQNQFKGAKSSLRIVTAKQVAHLCVSKPEGLRSEQQKFLNQLTQTNSVIAQCYELISQFCAMVKERRGSELDDWLERVYASEVKELQTFARQLEKDKAAVVAGLTLIWSQGQTEGQVQRLKYLKRQMYGQAGFSLLKRRLLHRNKNRSEYPFHVN